MSSLTVHSCRTAFTNDTGDIDPDSDFIPLPGLKTGNADLVICFLSSNGVRFSQKTDDPWFSAHRNGPVTRHTADNSTSIRYLSDEPARPLACTIQEQFCNPNLEEKKRCEPLRQTYSAPAKINNLWSSTYHQELLQWSSATIKGALGIQRKVQSLGASVLLARNSLFQGAQGPLPPNQWQLEVENIVSIWMASLQAVFFEAASGPLDPALEPYTIRPNTTAALKLCHSQVR